MSSFERFFTHFPTTDDLTLIVLKGHLLVEEEINDILDMKLKDSSAIYQARLGFHQRLAVLKALTGTGPDAPFQYSSIEKLNTLRNKIAHNLAPNDFERKIISFLKEIEDPEYEKEFEKQSLTERMKRCIAFICGELSGWKRGVEACQSLKIGHKP